MCFLAFSPNHLHNLSFQSRRLLFAHASSEVRSENMPQKVRLNSGSNSQPPGHESDILATKASGQGSFCQTSNLITMQNGRLTYRKFGYALDLDNSKILLPDKKLMVILGEFMWLVQNSPDSFLLSVLIYYVTNNLQFFKTLPHNATF